MSEKNIARLRSFGNCVRVTFKKGTLKAYAIKDPKTDLSETVKEDIFSEFYPVALSAFSQIHTPGFSKDVYRHIFNVEHLILVFDCEQDSLGVAFMTHSFMKHAQSKILYIEGVAISEQYQGLGINQNLVKQLIDGADYVAGRTQNPVFLTALSKMFNTVYPVTTKPDQRIISVGRHIADYLGMENYDQEMLVGRGTYGGALNGTFPNSQNAIQKAVYRLIDPSVGDSIIAVCPVK